MFDPDGMHKIRNAEHAEEVIDKTIEWLNNLERCLNNLGDYRSMFDHMPNGFSGRYNLEALKEYINETNSS